MTDMITLATQRQFVEIRPVKDKDFKETGTYSIWLTEGKGNLRDVSVKDLEKVFVALGQFFEEVKGGTSLEEGE